MLDTSIPANLDLPQSYSVQNPRKAEAVTPNDTTNLSQVSLLYIGGTGDLKVTTSENTTVVFASHPVGYMPIPVVKVFATSTTATNLVALY